jgi:rubrerythrin
MATLVGTQTNFADALRALIELDYDAIEAYKAAIDRIESESHKNELKKFEADHQRHVQELNAILRTHGEKEVDGPSGKQWLTKGKVVIADIFGDNSILQAMHSNEEDTNSAYERMNAHKDKWPDSLEVLRRGLLDEKHHKKWLEENGGAPIL